MAKPLPKTKAEKSQEARFASRPHLPEVVEIHNDEDLCRILTSYTWSPFIFRQARLQEDFLSTDFLVLDIDSGLSIEEAEFRVIEANIACLCVVTTSHKPEAPRFRLVFPLSRTITKVEEFIASMNDLSESFPEADPSCLTDSARYYFAQTMDEGFWIEGELLVPTKPVEVPKKESHKYDTTASAKVDLSIEQIVEELYGEKREYIPEAIAYFLKEAHTGLSGTWNHNLNKFCFVLTLQGIEEEVIYDLVEFLAPELLSKSDIATIKHSCKDGEKHRD